LYKAITARGYYTLGGANFLARPGMKQGTATEDFDVHMSYSNHNWRNISTRQTSNEIFQPSNKIHREVGLAKDLSAPRYAPPDLTFEEF
jgi:hypothetical protein